MCNLRKTSYVKLLFSDVKLQIWKVSKHYRAVAKKTKGDHPFS